MSNPPPRSCTYARNRRSVSPSMFQRATLARMTASNPPRKSAPCESSEGPTVRTAIPLSTNASRNGPDSIPPSSTMSTSPSPPTKVTAVARLFSSCASLCASIGSKTASKRRAPLASNGIGTLIAVAPAGSSIMRASPSSSGERSIGRPLSVSVSRPDVAA